MSQGVLAVEQKRMTPLDLARKAKSGFVQLWKRYPSAAVALIIIVVVLFGVIFAELLTPFEPNDRYGTRLGDLMEPAKAKYGDHTHILGTDQLTRDVFTRVLHGGRISLIVGLVAPTLGIAVGAMVGITGAYFGGYVDLILQRITDTLMAIPTLVLAMAITITFGFNVWIVIIALAVGISPYASRLLRSHVLVIRNAQYVEASKAMGATHLRVIFRHLVPNSWAPWIVLNAVNIGNAIVTEASLSYLGIGIAPPTSTWGNLLINVTTYWRDSPHLVLAPGLAITIVVLCSNMFGDAIRDMLDPRLRGAD